MPDTPEIPRYTNLNTGKSTPHAKEVAERNTPEKREALKEIVSKNLPDRSTLNWLDQDHRYIVKATDTKGILEILKQHLKGAKLDDQNFVRLAYGHVFNKVNKTMATDPGANKEKTWDVNFLEAGDTIFVKNGTVYIQRKANSTFASFGVDLYPWPNATAPKKVAPKADTSIDIDL